MLAKFVPPPLLSLPLLPPFFVVSIFSNRHFCCTRPPPPLPPSFRANPHVFGCLPPCSLSSVRGVCRKLGQGEVGYVATTHTMSGVYRKWDCQRRNPVDTTWKTTPKNKEVGEDLTKRVVPGASKGQVSTTSTIASVPMIRNVTNRSFFCKWNTLSFCKTRLFFVMSESTGTSEMVVENLRNRFHVWV